MTKKHVVILFKFNSKQVPEIYKVPNHCLQFPELEIKWSKCGEFYLSPTPGDIFGCHDCESGDC